jgi:hypothetical protein
MTVMVILSDLTDWSQKDSLVNVFMFSYTFHKYMSEGNSQTITAEEKENDELKSTRDDNEALNKRQATAQEHKEKT